MDLLPAGAGCGSMAKALFFGFSTFLKEKIENSVNLDNENGKIPLLALGRGFDICLFVYDIRR